jgi:hypothetical protein
MVHEELHSLSVDHVSTSADATVAPEEERDEVKEVKKHAARDTTFVRTWRVVVTGVLLTTALAVTLTTHHFLQKVDEKNFDTAVSERASQMGAETSKLLTCRHLLLYFWICLHCTSMPNSRRPCQKRRSTSSTTSEVHSQRWLIL